MRVKLAVLEQWQHWTACTMAWSWLAEAPPGAVVGPLVVPVVPPGSEQRQHLRSMPGALQFFMDDRAQLWTRSWQPWLLKACVLGRPVGAPVLNPPPVHSPWASCTWTAARALGRLLPASAADLGAPLDMGGGCAGNACGQGESQAMAELLVRGLKLGHDARAITERLCCFEGRMRAVFMARVREQLLSRAVHMWPGSPGSVVHTSGRSASLRTIPGVF